MILVLASRYDTAAAALVERWSECGARLVTCEQVGGPGWRWDSDEPERATLELDGDVLSIAAVQRIVSLLPAVTMGELPHIVDDEREYVAGEVMAFLLAWLSSLRTRVVNPPTPLCLTGPHLHREQWLQAASHAGLAIEPSVRRSERFGMSGPAPGVRPTEPASTVLVPVVAGRPLLPAGEASDARVGEAAVGVARLANAVGAVLMTAVFAEVGGGLRLTGAVPTVDVGRPDVADALLAAVAIAS